MIILLNGTSSSGKTALLSEVKVLRPDMAIFKIDDWIPKEVEDKAESLGWGRQSGTDPWLFLHEHLRRTTGKVFFDSEVRQTLFPSTEFFYRAAKQAAATNPFVFIDTVLEYREAYEEFDAYFSDVPVQKVLVYCSLDILIKRVEARNLGLPDERRTVFQSFEQFPAMYTTKQDGNRQRVDKIERSATKNALDAAIQDLIIGGIPESYLAKLNRFKADFESSFEFGSRNELDLFANDHYDIILDASKKSSQELAHQLFRELVKS